MNISEYLQKYQQVIYRSFCNAIKYNKLSHAYLIVGNQGTPIKEVATYLAKSLLCDSPTPLACNSCLTCMRVDDGNYADFILVDGSKGTVKKSDIQNIIETFDKKALESKGVQVYIIHQIENMTTEAVNSLLKFLEEPGKNIYAFLTTENEIKLLPTIISRTQKLTLRPINQKDIINDAVNAGVAQDDAQILSFFYSDSDLIKEVSSNNDYILAKDGVINVITKLASNKMESNYYIEKELIPLFKTKESVIFFLDILTVVFEELVKLTNSSSIVLETYAKILTSISTSYSNIEDTLLEIMLTRGYIDLNVNLSLVLDHIGYTLLLMKGAL